MQLQAGKEPHFSPKPAFFGDFRHQVPENAKWHLTFLEKSLLFSSANFGVNLKNPL